mgnify:CR=1 FL=1
MSIPITSLSAKQLDSTSFKVSGNIEISCKAATTRLCNAWMNHFQGLNRPLSIFPECAYQPAEIPADIIQKRCELSATACLDGSLKGAELTDIIKFIIIHCSEPQSGKLGFC